MTINTQFVANKQSTCPDIACPVLSVNTKTGHVNLEVNDIPGLAQDLSGLDTRVSKNSAAIATTQLAVEHLNEKVEDAELSLLGHIDDLSNPHAVTKAQVGLGNVDNTSDLNKPVSTSVKIKLDVIDTTLNQLKTGEQGNTNAIESHTIRIDNPHSVTKAQVGLGNVDNTSDLNKPVSTATRDLVNLTQGGLESHSDNTSNPHKVTKAQVGLGNVDNTRDVDKPVSTAVKKEIDSLKNKDSEVDSSLKAVKSELDKTQSELLTHIEHTSNPHKVTKAQVGLGNVDNTSDLDKPLSYVASTAIGQIQRDISDFKEITNEKILHHSENYSNPHKVTKAQVGLGNVDNTSDLDKPISIEAKEEFRIVTDKVSNNDKYIKERGATLPYESQIEYKENSLVFKDLEYQIKEKGVWETFLQDKRIRTWSGTTQEQVNRRQYYLEDFGGVGDGVTDNVNAFNKAFETLPENSTLYLEAGKVYFTSNIKDIGRSINVSSHGRATVLQQKGTSTGFSYTKAPDQVVNLIGAHMIDSRYWKVDSVEGIKTGQLFEVKSSASWYYDPRAESTDARKSELHRVLYVIPSTKTVVTEMEANDGYPETEQVTATLYSPLTVTVSNIDFKCKERGVRQGRGVRIKQGYRCNIINCTVTDYGSTPTALECCYESNILNCKITGCVNDATYASKITGCTLCFANYNYYAENYAAVDISGFNIISLMCGANYNVVNGGGVNNKGELLGYENGAFRSASRGVGSHSPVDKCSFIGNKLIDCSTGAIVGRGLNLLVKDNEFYGRQFYACVRLYMGRGARVVGNIVNNSLFGGKDEANSFTSSNRVNYPRALIHFTNDWNFDEYNPTIIDSNIGTYSNSLIELGDSVDLRLKGVEITNNTIKASTRLSSQIFSVITKRTVIADKVVNVSKGFIYKNNFLTNVHPTGKHSILPEGSLCSSGAYIESDGTSEEEKKVSIVGAVLMDSPDLLNVFTNFKGNHVQIDFMISGGTISAADNQNYSLDFKVPFIVQGLNKNSHVLGAASSLEGRGVLSYSYSTSSPRLTMNRESTSVTPSFRGYLKYPLGK